MITVEKHGFDKFRGRCNRCDCIFTYELNDIKELKVKCPDCGDMVNHYSEDGLISSQKKDKKK